MTDPEIVAEALEKRLTPDSVFWDIGAFEGRYATLAAEEGASVYAFEPSKENFATLTRRVPRGVTCCKYAVGHENGFSELVNDGGHESTVRVVAGSGTPVWTMDTLVGENGVPPPTHAKIDVEGMEANVLRGGLATLERHRPVLLIEIHDDVAAGPGLAGYGDTPEAVHAILDDLGYTVTQLTDTERTWHLLAE